MPTANDSPGSPASSAQIARPAPGRTGGHGSEPASTPSITVFISVACGAGRSGEPNVKALPRSSTVPAIAQQANAAPRNWPNCWRAGVAPTSQPVLRSCEMSPAFDAAIQTTVPAVRMAARADGSFQPRSTKTIETPSSVTSVIADVGFDDTPIRPTMREETTTKQTPKIATPIAAINRGAKVILPAKSPGTTTSVMTTTSGTTATTHAGTSRAVRSPKPIEAPTARTPRATAAKELHIVGSARATATSPAAATAPAPMKRTCFDQICPAVSAATGPLP